MPDLYKILNVPRDADNKQIDKAYKNLALKWHPEKAPLEHKEEYKKTYERIKEAYDILINDKSRLEYNVATSNTFNDLKNIQRDLDYQQVDKTKLKHVLDEEGNFDESKFNKHFENVNNVNIKEPNSKLKFNLKYLEYSTDDIELGNDSETLEQFGISGNSSVSGDKNKWAENFNRLFEQTKSKQTNNNELAELNDIPQANNFTTQTGLAELSKTNEGTLLKDGNNADPFNSIGIVDIGKDTDSRVDRNLQDLLREREAEIDLSNESNNRVAEGYNFSEISEMFPNLFVQSETIEPGNRQ